MTGGTCINLTQGPSRNKHIFTYEVMSHYFLPPSPISLQDKKIVYDLKSVGAFLFSFI